MYLKPKQQTKPKVFFTLDLPELAISDYQLFSRTQLGEKPSSTIPIATVEGCAELCTLEDSYLCRSFDFYPESRQCNLFRENVKDSAFVKLNIIDNPSCNHYSSN
jgi:hypothetical protein